MRKASNGFTIVELLIVVVVIAILAAITIVSYTGIKNRADAARASAAVDSFAKILSLHKVEKGSYPTTSTFDGVCLGKPSDFPAAGAFLAGECAKNPAGFTLSASQSLADALAPYGTNNGLLSQATFIGTEFGDEPWRGMQYLYSSSSTAPRLRWMVNGPTSCEPGYPLGTPGSWWGVTRCEYFLPK